MGQPRRAPRGSGPTPPDDASRGWDAILVGAAVLITVVAAVAWLV